MSKPRLPLRLILFAVLAIGGVFLIGFLVGIVNSVLELYERLLAMPLLVRLPLILAIALAVMALALLAWKLLRPTRAPTTRRDPRQLPTRPQVDARVTELRARDEAAASLQSELLELDRRRLGGECYVAVFGEISTGKSSLIRALAAQAAPEVDVLGGTTRLVQHFRGTLPDGRELVLADVPGSGEVDGHVREQLARDESLRAHAVICVAASDLTRAQDAELRWLHDFGKPIVLVLNKTDQLSDAERAALLGHFRERYAALTHAIVAVSAGGRERFERTLADGRREQVERDRVPDIAALTAALTQVIAGGSTALEPAREAAVLARVDERAGELAQRIAARESEETVVRYTRRAVIGALAAVAPGSDILIQGALGTALVRELARIHGVPVREIDVENLLARLGLTVRNTTAIVLAIAGNAFKAFPGLGTLGGGMLHAVAYGLVFDALGRAIAATLSERAQLDLADSEQRVRNLLAEPGKARVERVARIVLDAVRERPDRD